MLKNYEPLNDHYNNIITNGARIAAGAGNWDYFAHNGIVYFIPKKGTGAGAGFFCAISKLKRHLQQLQYICNYSTPTLDWEVLDHGFFRDLGII